MNVRPVKHLYLDLEGTAIAPLEYGWLNTRLINTTKLRGFVERFRPDFIHVFSFALRTRDDVRVFEQVAAPALERRLDQALTTSLSVNEDILPAVGAVLSLAPDRISFRDLSVSIGKAKAFHCFLQHAFASNTEPAEVILLDDMVEDEAVAYPALQVSGRILNIDRLA